MAEQYKDKSFEKKLAIKRRREREEKEKLSSSECPDSRSIENGAKLDEFKKDIDQNRKDAESALKGGNEKIDSETEEDIKEIKNISEDVVQHAEDAKENADKLTKKQVLAFNSKKAEEIIEKIGFLEKKKNNGEVPNNPEEEVENADKLARLIENSKYIKEQELRLKELNSIYESYKKEVYDEAYDNESDKIISEINKLSLQDENNGR